MGREIAAERWERALRSLPSRYQEPWKEAFDEVAVRWARSSMAILDIGSGRYPSLSPEQRPDARYVGLDMSASELALAPAGSYSETVVGDASAFHAELEARFDLAVSWQVLEHVRDIRSALTCVHRYLRPGGHLVAQLSGGRSLFALANRAIPNRLASVALTRFLDRDPGTVFPAYYDGCTYRALSAALSEWQDAAVTPLYRGAAYFSFSRPLLRAYVAFEDWAMASGRRDLATHYRIVACK